MLNAHLNASVQSFEHGENWLEAARTHAAWGSICRERGDEAAARSHLAPAAKQFAASGLTIELAHLRVAESS
jgi:hypothetical protein